MIQVRIKQGKDKKWRAIAHSTSDGYNRSISPVRGFASYDEAEEHAQAFFDEIQRGDVQWLTVNY